MTISLHPDTAGSPGLAAAPGAEAGPPAAGPKTRSRLFVKYVALFVGVVSLALLSNGIFEVFFYYRETRASLIRIQHEQAEAAAAKIGQFVTEIESQLGWTTQLPWSAASLEQRRFDALRLLRQVPAITELAQVDSTGKERLKVSRLAMDVVDSGLDLSADPKFTEAIAHKVYYGPVYFRRESEPYMTLSLAGTRKDAGVSIAEVNLKLIVDVVSLIKVGEKGQAYVVDTQGRLIAHPDISLVLRNTDMSKLEQVQAARAGGSGVDILKAVKNLQGQDVLSASAPVEPLGWTIFVELPVAEAFAPLYTALQRLAFVLLGALAFAVLAGLFLARRMIVPIQALSAGAALIGGGNFSQRIQIKTGDELESLADQFNDMGARLQESYADLENKVERRTAELKETLDQQTATSEVLQVISSSTGDVEPVFQKLLENATRVCGAEFGTMLLYEDGKMSRVARYNAPAAYDAEVRTNVFAPRPDSALGTVIRTRQVVQVHDLCETKPYLERDPAVIAIVELAGARTLVTVPMLRDEELIGVIAIYRQEVRPFSEKQIELLKNFASQAVIAIENTRLIVETREALEQQTATAEVLGVINASRGDLMPVFKAMVERAVHLCKADSGHLALPDREDYRTVVVAAMSPEMESLIRGASFSPGRGTAIGRALLEKRPAQIDDVHTDSEHVGPKGLIRTILGVPLLREGEPIGAFGLSRSRVEPFTEREVELVRTFASQAVIAIENTRLLKELHARTDDLSESLQQQTATADVLKVISRSAFDLKAVLDTLVESAASLCTADTAIIFVRDGEVFRAGSTFGADPQFLEALKSYTRKAGRDSIAARVILSGAVEQIPDVYEDKEYHVPAAAFVPKQRALIGVPLLRDGRVEGVFALIRNVPGLFAPREVALLQTFADQAVIALQNVRLFEEVQARTSELSESLQQQTATADVLKVISRSAFDLDSVLSTLVESAAKLCEAEKGVIFLREESQYCMAYNYGFSPEFEAYAKAHPLPEDGASSTARAGQTGVPVQAVNIATDDQRMNEVAREYRRLGEYRTNLGVPLRREGQTIGVFTLTRQEAREFTARQIELVQTFADQAVIAIQNVRLFDEVQARTSELSESLQQQTATADVLKVISRSTFDLQTVLHTLVESAAKLTEADKATITRQRDGVFYRAESYGFSDEFMNYVRTVPVVPDRGSASGRALLEGTVVHIPDVKADTDYTFNEAQRLGDFRAILAVPMLREGSPVGVIVLTRTEPRAFTDKQIELVTTFADQAAIAIENVRLFDQVQAQTQELTQSLDDLRTAQDRLVQTEKLASLGQLTAGIAHEIKNPLNFVNNFSALSAELIDELLEVLGSTNLPGKAKEEVEELTHMLKGNLEKVVQHGKRADSIVKNMLLHSREGSGEHRPVDINAVVDESLNLAYHGARAEKSGFNITLERKLDPDAGLVDIYPQEMTRVFLNLISNGFYAATKRKASAGDGFEPTLTASTKNLGNAVEVRIRDNGTGIPPEVKEKMFNPFFTTKPAGEGTGLGLSMSHDIVVKQHGGRMDVATEPDVFTEFIITLPRAAAAMQSGSRT